MKKAKENKDNALHNAEIKKQFLHSALTLHLDLDVVFKKYRYLLISPETYVQETEQVLQEWKNRGEKIEELDASVSAKSDS